MGVAFVGGTLRGCRPFSYAIQAVRYFIRGSCVPWVKSVLLIASWVLLSSATAPVAPLDVNEAGRVMAELDDWRTLMYVMLFLIVLLVMALLWAFGKISKTVEVMASLRETITALNATATTAGTHAINNDNTLQNLVGTMSRIERDLADVRQEMSRWE